jgi:glyoxylase-like metal-dependent hydrolase (beta-lactamase superfamily II)
MMNRREALAAGAGVAAGVILAGPSALARTARPRLFQPENEPEAVPAGFFPWKQVAEGVHAIVDPETGGNCILVISKDHALLVDTKYPSVGQALLREAQARSPGLRYVVNTHHHGDHTGGNAAFNAAAIPVVAHPKAEPRILANFEQYVGQIGGGPRFVGGLDRPTQARVLDEAGELTESLRHMDASDFGPTLLMTGDEMTLDLGDRAAELTHFGHNAHTDNDTVVHIKDANLIHTGDLVFNGLHPFFDPTAGVTASGWITVLGRVRALCDKNTVIVPGHGPVGDIAIIDRQADYLKNLIDAVQAEIDAGTTREEAARKSWPFMDGLGFEQIRPRAIGAVYDELGDP